MHKSICYYRVIKRYDIENLKSLNSEQKFRKKNLSINQIDSNKLTVAKILVKFQIAPLLLYRNNFHDTVLIVCIQPRMLSFIISSSLWTTFDGFNSTNLRFRYCFDISRVSFFCRYISFSYICITWHHYFTMYTIYTLHFFAKAFMHYFIFKKISSNSKFLILLRRLRIIFLKENFNPQNLIFFFLRVLYKSLS